MKWVFQVQHKLRVAVLLMVIIVTVLLCNLSIRQSFGKLDDTITSLYNDRLMPATYIFKMTDLLYTRQLTSMNGTASLDHLKKSSDSLQRLMNDFAKTWLTVSEEGLFKKLGAALAQTNILEQQWLQWPPEKRTLVLGQPLRDSYDRSIQLLGALSAVQMQEGSTLHSSSKKVIAGTQIESQFEISLLIILGIVAFVLVAAKEKIISKEKGKAWMN